MHICYNGIWVIKMAEFCLECWNRINEANDPASKYIISKDLDLCEGCAQLKNVIIMERKYYYLRKFRFIIFPFKIIYNVLYFLSRILILPYLIYKYKKRER